MTQNKEKVDVSSPNNEKALSFNKSFNKTRVLDDIEQLFHIRAVPHRWKVKNDIKIDRKKPLIVFQPA